MYDEVIRLLTMEQVGKDQYGDPNEVPKGKEVFACIKSITQSEFYQAQTAGVKPEIKFVIADYVDYEGQQHLEHEGMRYKVLRTYRKQDSNELEIICYGGVRDVNAAVSHEDTEGQSDF